MSTTSDRARELADEWYEEWCSPAIAGDPTSTDRFDEYMIPKIAALLDLLVEARERLSHRTIVETTGPLIEKIDRVLGGGDV